MISCISYGLLYDWPSHLREQINRTFQFRNGCIHGNNPRAVLVWEKREKMSLPVGKCYLPMGKKASVTTTIRTDNTPSPKNLYFYNSLQTSRAVFVFVNSPLVTRNGVIETICSVLKSGGLCEETEYDC